MPAITVTAAAESAFGPDEGYVAGRSATGTKTDTPIIETPQTINVITRDEFTARAAQNVSQALTYTPGGNPEPFGLDDRNDYIRLRGFIAPQYLNGLLLPGTGLTTNFQFDPYGLERIEVLKGPASVLYGQNAPGGLINLVSKRPTAEPFHEIQLLGGSFDRVQGGLDLSGPFERDGRFLYRLTALVHDSDTQVDFSEDDRYFVAPSFAWRPSKGTTFTFLSHYQKDETGNAGRALPAEGTLLPNPNGKIPANRALGEPEFDRFVRELFHVGYAFEHRFNEAWSVRQNLRYASLTANENSFSFINGFETDINGVPTDFRTVTRGAIIFPVRDRVFTLDNQAQGVFDTGAVHHTALFGIDYWRMRKRDELGFAEEPNLDLFNPVYGQPFTLPVATSSTDQKIEQFGLYGQDQIKYGGWILTLGGRYDWATADTLIDDRDAATHTETRQDDEAFTYRTGLGYVFDSGFAPYFSYSESFQPSAGTDFFGKPFEPTTGQQYEVGVKYGPLAGLHLPGRRTGRLGPRRRRPLRGRPIRGYDQQPRGALLHTVRRRGALRPRQNPPEPRRRAPRPEY